MSKSRKDSEIESEKCDATKTLVVHGPVQMKSSKSFFERPVRGTGRLLHDDSGFEDAAGDALVR